jgi:hypothetical protein
MNPGFFASCAVTLSLSMVVFPARSLARPDRTRFSVDRIKDGELCHGTGRQRNHSGRRLKTCGSLIRRIRVLWPVVGELLAASVAGHVGVDVDAHLDWARHPDSGSVSALVNCP